MKLRLLSASVALSALAACSSISPKYAYVEPVQTMRLTLLPHNTLAVGKLVAVDAKLTSYKTLDVVPADALAQKMQLLAVDSTLTDYQQIQPQATNIAGLYQFNFTPRLPGSYRVWADVTPTATKKQEFDAADLGAKTRGNARIVESQQANVGEYRFTLAFDKKLVEGQQVLGTIHVSDAKGDVKNLQPVTGAFTHVVGFYGDLHTVVSTHTMGTGPKTDAERNGPDVTFQMTPVKSGMVKLFARFKINGREYVVPFGVNVAGQATK